MGTKGRDIAIWGIYFTLPLALVMVKLGYDTLARGVYLLALVSGIWLLYFQFITVPIAIRKSRSSGLKRVVVLPIVRPWANWMIKQHMNADYKKAYEIHIISKPTNLWEFVAALEADLRIIDAKYKDCLFLWETSAPVPSNFRKLIKRHIKVGSAFWQKSGWPIPRPPFVSRQLKRGQVRSGALVWKGE
ncbi:conserved hypothetical protein [Desulforamulus reducens MI-1]|uniref:Uncharacterized protein n=1 Tax=Desulforamulus reducens (strain ATCC BAA-1160 / DSM 100696 / MI-1) TaxID=349161 RepID=A4J330_DESRM|nr:hypothetical protein [Desulforamulus reducens]ABO49483.1 conserved hypothetical protein [Desulforamulus reducens MI-1]